MPDIRILQNIVQLPDILSIRNFNVYAGLFSRLAEGAVWGYPIDVLCLYEVKWLVMLYGKTNGMFFSQPGVKYFNSEKLKAPAACPPPEFSALALQVTYILMKPNRMLL